MYIVDFLLGIENLRKVGGDQAGVYTGDRSLESPKPPLYSVCVSSFLNLVKVPSFKSWIRKCPWI